MIPCAAYKFLQAWSLIVQMPTHWGTYLKKQFALHKRQVSYKLLMQTLQMSAYQVICLTYKKTHYKQTVGFEDEDYQTHIATYV